MKQRLGIGRRGWLGAGAWLLAGMTILGLRAQVAEVQVTGRTAEVIPISLTGFAGEARQVLEFDLFVGGFNVVPAGQGRFDLAGGGAAEVRGTLSDASKQVIFNRVYPGGSVRASAHALADDVIKAATGAKVGFTTRKIVFRVESGQRNKFKELVSELYVADYDGANAVRLTQDDSIVRSPAWFPGRRTVYYTSYRNGLPHIYSHDLGSGARQPFASYGGMNDGIAFSADGSRVAMVLSKAGSPDLWVGNSDGSGLRRLTTTREEESSPTWSPDGRTLCFTSSSGGGTRLYTVDAGGGAMKALNTAGVWGATEPDWSPDGKWIAFTRMGRGVNFEVYVVPATGGTPRKVADGEDAVWAPNSRTLLFVRRTRGGPRRLSLLDVPTGHVKDGTSISGSCSQPSWAR